MFRICLAALAAALIIASAATPSTANQLKNGGEPTACDCSNCSAEHCQGSRTATYHLTDAWPSSGSERSAKKAD